MYNYSLSLALFDFIPVILSGLGWYWLSRWVSLKAPQYQTALVVGGLLVVLGGISKVSWKLVIAVSGNSIEFLNNNLFLFMMPGFALIFAAVWRAVPCSPTRPSRDPLIYGGLLLTLLCPVVISTLSAHPRAWFLALVGVTTLFNCMIIGRLCIYAWPRGQRLTASLFVFNLLAAFVLSALARTGDHSEAMQWLEEIINTGAQGALAFAAYRLTQKEQKRSSL
ncbi:MAG TPA: hypothetical protein DIW43_00140 [Spongiibacteraceae bacterium]|nr:hypothetical protein [Spongiibacteraceae bacterium]HCS25829.1 hypothetical protein [Spongiibacteraceae bacterium]